MLSVVPFVCLLLLLAIMGTNVKGMRVVQVDPAPEIECFGTNVGFGYSGSKQVHYNRLRRRYEGCTVVRGNLEIANLDDPSMTYDLSFLQSIRTVTGYVLIGLVYVEVVPLINLQLIRGDNLFELPHQRYGLAVVLTTPPDGSTGVRQLLLPALREISRGQVLFSRNPLLCHVDTVRWDVIVRQQSQYATPVVFRDVGRRQDCEACDEYCTLDGHRHCWGPGPQNCQQISNVGPCPTGCRNGCYHSNGEAQCCDAQCAGGCWGPSSFDCQLCKYFYYQNQCVTQCPPKTYPLGQQC